MDATCTLNEFLFSQKLAADNYVNYTGSCFNNGINKKCNAVTLCMHITNVIVILFV